MAKEVKIQWHPAFCSAMELTFIEDEKVLTFDREYNLSRKPLQVDLLVIKKKPGAELHNEIGQIFGEHNIIEYKSPKDELSIDTYFKAIGYGCIYKALNSKHVDQIRADDITLTLLRNSKPVKMLEELEKTGTKIEQKYPGIYYLSGKHTLFRTQVVVSGEMTEDGYAWIRALTDELKPDDAEQLVNAIPKRPIDEAYRQRIDSVLQVVMSANQQVFDTIRKEDPVMCDALREFFKDDIEEAVQKEKKNKEDGIKVLLQTGDTPLTTLYTAFGKDEVDAVAASLKKN